MSKNYTITGGSILLENKRNIDKRFQTTQKVKIFFSIAADLTGWLSSIRRIGYTQQSFSQWIPQSFAENFRFFQNFTKKS